MGTKISTYEKDGKSFPTLELKTDDDKYGLTFGVSKARLILNNIDAIRDFVEKNKR